MYKNYGEIRKLIRTKIVVGVLLLVSSGLTLTACQNVKFGSESIKKQKENQPAKSDQKLKKDQSTSPKSKKSDQKPSPGQDNTVDDDPE